MRKALADLLIPASARCACWIQGSEPIGEPTPTATPTPSSSPGWAQETDIKAADCDSHDRFAFSTYLDGDTIEAGAYFEGFNRTSVTNGGAAPGDNSNSTSEAVDAYRFQ